MEHPKEAVLKPVVMSLSSTPPIKVAPRQVSDGGRHASQDSPLDTKQIELTMKKKDSRIEVIHEQLTTNIQPVHGFSTPSNEQAIMVRPQASLIHQSSQPPRRQGVGWKNRQHSFKQSLSSSSVDSAKEERILSNLEHSGGSHASGGTTMIVVLPKPALPLVEAVSLKLWGNLETLTGHF